MTDEELLTNSDLVVDATGESVVCDGPATDDGDRFTSTYVTTLAITETIKGTAPTTTEVVGYVEEYKQAHPGCAATIPPIPEGFSGRLFLVDNGDGTFSPTHYNAMKPDAANDPQAFLDCGGAGGVGGAAGAAGTGGATGGSGGSAAGGSGGTAGSDAAPASDDSGCNMGLGSTSSSSGALALAAIAIAARVRRRRSAVS
jgi:MYXO-CTERM domain-containing protein